MHITKWKNSIWKSYRQYNSNYMMFWKRLNYGDREISNVRGWERVWMDKQVDHRFLQRRQWHPTPVLLTGKSHGQRSLVGCSPWGREDLDMTEWLHFHFCALEKEMATHSSVLAWRIPGMGSQWSDLAAVAITQISCQWNCSAWYMIYSFIKIHKTAQHKEWTIM